MEEIKKMLRAVINGQSALRQEVVARIEKLEEKVDTKADGKEMREGFKNMASRLDIQGKTLANLEDDAPTMDEFEKLEKRVTNIET